MVSNFIKYQSFLLVSIPPLLITGPFFSDFALSLLVICTTFYIIKEKQYQYFQNKFVLFFSIFYFYILLNSLIINVSLDSIKISFFYFRFGLFAICVWYLLDQDETLLKKIFISMCICFIILIIDGFIQFFFHSNILGFKISETGRISSFFNTELVLGSYLSRLFPIFFGLSILLFNKKKKYLVLVSVIFVLVETLIFISGERAALFYTNLSAIYIILCIKNFKKLRLITFLASIGLIFIVSYFSPSYKERVVDLTMSQMGINKMGLANTDTNRYLFSKQHTHHFLSAKKMFESDILFGIGIKNFKNFCGKDEYKISNISCSTHPHNTYVQLLAETGIFGFLYIVGVLIYFSMLSLKFIFTPSKKANLLFDFRVCIVSAIIISLWPLIPTGSFFNNWLNIIYYLPIGFLIYYFFEPKDEY